MPVVNPLLQWRQVITPATARTVSTVREVLADGRLKCELRGGQFITLAPSGLGLVVGDLVLSSDGQAVRKLANLPTASQGV